MARKQPSKKLRFEVFKRDEFTCQYCGATPPSVILHVDHISPVAGGGGNEIDNLITACESCNQGKGARLLSSTPKSLKDRGREISEREEQLRQYNDVLLERAERIDVEAWQIARSIEGYDLESYRADWILSIKRFLELLTYTELLKAAEITTANTGLLNRERRFKYFCAVCWNMVRGQKNG